MRVVLLLLLVAACGGRGDRDPAWPKRADPEVDGGESLAPRTTSVVAASESKKETKADEKSDAKPDDAKVADKDKDKDKDKPAEVKPAATVLDDIIIIDDIVIEIED